MRAETIALADMVVVASRHLFIIIVVDIHLHTMVHHGRMDKAMGVENQCLLVVAWQIATTHLIL